MKLAVRAIIVPNMHSSTSHLFHLLNINCEITTLQFDRLYLYLNDESFYIERKDDYDFALASVLLCSMISMKRLRDAFQKKIHMEGHCPNWGGGCKKIP